MLTMKLVVLALACAAVRASMPPPAMQSTIFTDEKLEGEIFEGYDTRNDVVSRNLPEDYRLPTTTRPSHYNILWTIYFADFTVGGRVVIQLHATQPGVSRITLQSKFITINSVQLTQGTTVIATNAPILDEELEFLYIDLTSTNLAYNAAERVDYTLTIEFTAEMRDDMYGIYRSWFRNNPNDVTVSWMAATQFQGTSARRAFPCYDEPSFKATFDITIRRPTSYSSWSCTRISQTNLNVVAGYDEDVFHTTPYMSTYLLAIIVAEYQSIRYPQTGDLTYEVIARPGAIAAAQGQYSYDVGQLLLTEMNSHTALDFYSVNPNLKMTQAAIPDFSAGAMENWGLLTYREAYLMYDENHTNSNYKQLIAYILSHEIAHMWFGNLVTCDWWDVLWLNEGFARYYQYFLTHWVEDYMGLDTRFITEQVHTAFLADSVLNAHPLSTSGIGSAAQVSGMFTTLSYNKGAAVIRMTEHLLGFEIHRQGLRNYLADKAFTAVLPIDLFQHLQTVAELNGAISNYPDFSVIDYYRSFTEQPGVPVLNVQVNHQTGDMTITQRRFDVNTGYTAVDQHWIIPITFSTASNPDFTNTKPTHILRNGVTVINRGSVGDEWVLFNKQQTGYYRVNYDDYTWNLITLALKSPTRTTIHEYNRAQIVNDVCQYARSGIMTYSRALTILSFLEEETSYAPWVAAMTCFTWLRNRYVGTQYLTPLENTISSWATNVMNDITYYPTANEDFMRSYLRLQLAPIMCQMGNQACRTAAIQQFQALQQSGTEVPVDSRTWVYCNALREGGAAEYNFLWTRYNQHNVYTEKILLLSVLGCTPDATSLNSFLTNIIEDNYVIRRQDYTTAYNSAVSGNEGNTQIVFTFIRNNLQAVIDGFRSTTLPLLYVSGRLRTEAEIVEFENWANANAAILGESLPSVLNEAAATRASIAWAQNRAAELNTYLVNGDEEVSSTTPAPVTPENIVTEAQPDMSEPSTPAIPDSASTTFISMSVAAVALAAYVFA